MGNINAATKRALTHIVGHDAAGRGGRAPVLDRATVAALLADTALTYDAVVSAGNIVTAGPHRLEAKASDAVAADYDWASGGGIRFRALPGADNLVSAEALGCDIVTTYGAAAGAADATSRIQKAMDRGNDVFVPGFIRCAGPLNPVGRRLIGAGTRQSGLWCSAAGAGVFATGIGTEVRGLSILSDFTAGYLLTLGDGVEGSTLAGIFADLYVSGAKTRGLMVREFANGKTLNSTIKQTGGRTGTTSVEDPRRHSAEIRCKHEMTNCEISASTGYAILVVSQAGWEETRLTLNGGCRAMSGYEGWMKVVAYDAATLCTVTMNMPYFENSGMTANPGVNNPSAGPAIVLQGPNARLRITALDKALIRKSTHLIGLYDGSRARLPMDPGAVRFQALGTAIQGTIAVQDVMAAPAFAAGVYVPDAGVLVTDGGNVYHAKAEATPFTTGATIDLAQWVLVSPAARVAGELKMEGIPSLFSGDTEAAPSLTDWKEFIRAPAMLNKLSADFTSKTKIATLLDGSTVSGMSFNAGSSAVTTTAGEFISGTGAVKVTGNGSTVSALNCSFPYTIPPDLVGHWLQVTAVHSYKQVGANLGNATTAKVRTRLRVAAGTATILPADSSSLPLDITPGPGDGVQTGWYKQQHVFRVTTAGTVTVSLVLDDQTIARDDIAFIDRMELFVVPSADGGAYA
ncbi:hypothetical protein [Amaricoccus solimangrovi]|uniref:Uncharacterized protein n=1 Tax=Amaricoccus solimangrovi TaxID=2589815 RepID=A0A501WA87_9RHOB|nr:hypothetical protein [Amaricoccus solimangrovi]TPE44131.1 hypothetical protein FJM51_23175 [Amaricoccus solimangrovi]